MVEKSTEKEAQDVVDKIKKQLRVKMVAKHLATIAYEQRQIEAILEGKEDCSSTIRQEVENYFKIKKEDC